jgi:hypothetical protein
VWDLVPCVLQGVQINTVVLRDTWYLCTGRKTPGVVTGLEVVHNVRVYVSFVCSITVMPWLLHQYVRVMLLLLSSKYKKKQKFSSFQAHSQYNHIVIQIFYF